MDKIKLDFKNKYYLNNSDYLSSYRDYKSKYLIDKDYKSLYYKYKTKYLKALKKYNQVGGAEKDKLDKIIEMYQKIPETGLYGDNISLEKFKEYCKFVIEETKDDPEIIDLKRKQFLEKKNLQKTDEYKKLAKKIKQVGKKYQKLGSEFEKDVFENLLKDISEIKKIPVDNLKLLKNPNLFIKNTTSSDEKTSDSEFWEHIGEIDAVVLQEKEVIGICEIKKSFDDIPDALFQIKRSYNVMKERENFEIKIVTSKEGELFIDSEFILPEFLEDVSFIFTSFPEKILNIQSKIKFPLISYLNLTKSIKYNKLFKKTLKKKNSIDKLKNKKILRYDNDVLETINFFKNNKNQIIF